MNASVSKLPSTLCRSRDLCLIRDEGLKTSYANGEILLAFFLCLLFCLDALREEECRKYHRTRSTTIRRATVVATTMPIMSGTLVELVRLPLEGWAVGSEPVVPSNTFEELLKSQGSHEI
ncbi:hypothetical protein K435DRAFT_54240 [Dendrothele bispora CBS 962.96]|uniref:Uncharacterized protein n=1 Tax=Dendrothele bispora (strain CBS 962.96) TaxID=1314807 RepID=A0A4S8M7H2_DENBC|nr:hypothetical protein K435DRAFT_54240 [Dendrothele bispora CBS 962.96]